MIIPEIFCLKGSEVMIESQGPRPCRVWYSRAAESKYKLGAGNCPREQAGAPWVSLQVKTKGSHLNWRWGGIGRSRRKEGMPQHLDVLRDLGPDLALVGTQSSAWDPVQLVTCLESEPGGRTCAKIQVG